MYNQGRKLSTFAVPQLAAASQAGQYGVRACAFPALQGLVGRPQERPAGDELGELDLFEFSQLQLGAEPEPDGVLNSAHVHTGAPAVGSDGVLYAGNGVNLRINHNTMTAFGFADGPIDLPASTDYGVWGHVQGFTAINAHQAVNKSQQEAYYANLGSSCEYTNETFGYHEPSRQDGVLQAPNFVVDEPVVHDSSFFDEHGNLYLLWGPEGQNVSAEEGISELTHGATPTSRKRAPIPKPALEAVAKVQKARGRVVGSPNSRKGQTRMSSARTLVVAYHCLRFLANNSISEGDTIPKTVDLGIRKDLPDDIKFHYGTKLGLHNVLGQTKGLRGIIGDKIDWLRSKGYVEDDKASGEVLEAGKALLATLSPADFK